MWHHPANPIHSQKRLGGGTISSTESDPGPVGQAGENPPILDEAPHGEGKRKRSRGGIIAIILLSLALAAAVTVLALNYLKLGELERELQEQRELIDKKETFDVAMRGLLETAHKLDGVLMTSIVPLDRYATIAARAWIHRWSPTLLNRDLTDVRTAKDDLEQLLSAANVEATTNGTGTTYETVIDQLGGGFVASLIDDADSLCAADVLACVISDDPYTVHFDAADASAPYMTDWIRTGIAYHEFAHVLQMTNPRVTQDTLNSFGGDEETMADCFALTYLDGWSLDHTIWTSSYEYWDVSVGYGYSCDDAQRQAIRDWYGQLGFHVRPITQQH